LAWIGRTNLEELTVIFESGVSTGYAMMKADSSLKEVVNWATQNSMSTNKVTTPGEKAQWRAVLAYSVGGSEKSK